MIVPTCKRKGLPRDNRPSRFSRKASTFVFIDRFAAVVRGSDRPLVEPLAVCPEIHGDSGLDSRSAFPPITKSRTPFFPVHSISFHFPIVSAVCSPWLIFSMPIACSDPCSHFAVLDSLTVR